MGLLKSNGINKKKSRKKKGMVQRKKVIIKGGMMQERIGMAEKSGNRRIEKIKGSKRVSVIKKEGITLRRQETKNRVE